jgi:hypothetical protein
VSSLVTILGVDRNQRDLLMAKYRVTTTIESVQIIEAENPYAAAVLVGGNVTDVRPARGRLSGSARAGIGTKSAKKVAKKRKPLSPEARAKLAKNLVKARAARAKKLKAAKKTTNAKKTTKRSPAKKG